ncbi:MAG: hypothetical protein JWO05_2488 [Gemmatimonadetes bacterium]|nr:hypothetical protein [Gemmatimonadota bacterium]
MRLRRFLCLASAVITAAVIHPARLHAQGADVIRGRVIGPDSLPIAAVTVTATSISGNVNRSTRTGSDGRFTITFPNGDGDYMVAFAALGFGAKRFEVKRNADEDILVADAKLSRVAVTLDALKVTADRERVRRNDTAQPDISGTEQRVTDTGVPAADLGDLAAMAAQLPGVQSAQNADGSNGYSVLGLGADQNNTTLNGMNFGGSNLPRDAAVSSSLATSPYDVSRGGFSGAQFSLRSSGGNNFVSRGMSLNLDAPQLQWTDPAAQALGQQFTNVSLGGRAAGPIVFDKAFYSISYQLGRRSNDYQNLLNTDAVGFRAAGVSSDSVSRLLGLLVPTKIPSTVGGLRKNRTSDQGSLFGSLDFAPPSSTRGSAYNLGFDASWTKQAPAQTAASSSTELPSHSGERTNWRVGVTGRNNAYLHSTILTETSFGFSASRNYGSPYLQLPDGRVRVNSTFDDGSNGVSSLSFGGNQGLGTASTNTTANFLNQLSWFSVNNKHRLKLTTELRHESYAQASASNTLGTFTYNSLADLASNTPAGFSRQLGERHSSAGQVVGGVSLGDSWRRTPNLQLQYGVRVDANRFLADPNTNPAVLSAFNVSNDNVPNRVYVSPRLGFSYTLGTASQIASFDGAQRAPRAVIRGGVGMFQNTPGTQSINGAIDNTGLASAIQQLSCVGAATPVPNWTAYAASQGAIPTACADGTTGTVFSNTLPNVALFSPDFVSPRSVRSNLQWNGPVLNNRFSVTVDGTYSRNLGQQSSVDLNFDPTTRFTLADEANRPVYVNSSSIVPATGAIASRDARKSVSFSRVSEILSDLHSDSKQVRVSLNPANFSSSLSWGLNYVWSSVTEQSRGFSSTSGNPLLVESGRSSFDSHHQVTYSLGYNFFDAVRVSWFGSFRSGSPFTPGIVGDVNGDGYSNDRAYIFNPAKAGVDPTVAAGMQALLDHGSDQAKQCLRSQLGLLASRNSCQGPWTTNASMSISFNPVKVRMPQRASLSFQVSNPLGAADMALHGTNNLRGWGQANFVDQSLLYVRGFDAATNKYKYEVNQRFGSTNPAFNAFRAPVTLTALMRFDVGPTRERQSLSMQLDRGRTSDGDKLPEQLIKAIYGSGSVPNPMATILRQQDSLKLTAQQADSIAMLNRYFTIKLDQIWTPVAKFLAALPDKYDHDEAYEHFIQARHASIDLLSSLSGNVKGVLSAEQQRKLPSFITSYLDPRYLASIRNGTATFTNGSQFVGGGGNQQVFAAGGGGDGQRVIIRQ